MHFQFTIRDRSLRVGELQNGEVGTGKVLTLLKGKGGRDTTSFGVVLTWVLEVLSIREGGYNTFYPVLKIFSKIFSEAVHDN